MFLICFGWAVLGSRPLFLSVAACLLWQNAPEFTVVRGSHNSRSVLKISDIEYAPALVMLRSRDRRDKSAMKHSYRDRENTIDFDFRSGQRESNPHQQLGRLWFYH
jgi:hypothetical protein